MLLIAAVCGMVNFRAGKRLFDRFLGAGSSGGELQADVGAFELNAGFLKILFSSSPGV